MYPDSVVREKLVHRPAFLVFLVIISFAVFFALDLGEWIPRLLLAPIVGQTQPDGLLHRTIPALSLSLVFAGNIALIGMLPLRLQTIMIYAELGTLFLASFLVFNLDMGFIGGKLWFLVSQGVVTTVLVSVSSIAIASVIGFVGAIAKLSNNGFATGIAAFYTSLFRGLPLLMQIYLIYVGLPQFGFLIDAVPAGVAALSLCYGAYLTEIFRAGIQSIARGQWEASRALGFNFRVTMSRIILPQAFPLIVPPTGNLFIALLKDSSLVSVIGVWELMYLSRTLGTKTFQHMEMLTTAALMYWAMSVLLEFFQARIEARFRKSS